MDVLVEKIVLWWCAFFFQGRSEMWVGGGGPVTTNRNQIALNF